MSKYRIILAALLSGLVVFGWSYIARFMGWAPSPEPVTEIVSMDEQAEPTPQPFDDPRTSGFTPVAGQDVAVDTPLYKAVFYSGGGFLKEFVLSRYKANLTGDADVTMVDKSAARFAPLGVVLNGAPTWSRGNWEPAGQPINLEKGQKGSLRFVGSLDGLRLTREFSFDADTYEITEKFTLQNPTSTPMPVRLSFTIGTASLSDSDSKYNRTKISYVSEKDKFKAQDDLDDLKAGLKIENPRWGGIQSNYFLAALMPHTDSEMIGKLQDNVYRVAMELRDLRIEARQELVYTIGYYLGPKEKSCLEAAHDDLTASLDYGWFGFISRPFLYFLEFLYDLVGNYGVAIILLTAVIKLILWPLSQKSYRSMEKMKKVQPMIKQIQEKYEGDRQKIQQETMALYKAYNVNPMGGCLPMVIQIPIFIALYYTLLGAIQLRHAAFIKYLPFTHKLWLADLSAMDPYFITPILMGVTMLIQQKMTPSMGDPTQQKIMLAMPVIFTFMFAYFPSGLVLYWLSSNVISIIQQWFVLRKA